MMRTWRSVVVNTIFLCTLVTLTACVIGRSDLAGYGKLGLRFQTNAFDLEVGRPVHMQFTVTNEGSRLLVMESQDTPVMDIAITEAGSDQVYVSWSAQNPDQVSHRLEWKPGESRVIELTWTPKEENLSYARHIIFMTGLLSENSRVVKGAGVSFCARVC